MECTSIDLSILICHLYTRDVGPLLKKLKLQTDNRPVEIIVNGDNGELTIGSKRNELIRAAKGNYICFIDDDDDVSCDYTSSILSAIEKKPDVIGIEGEITFDNKKTKFYHSIDYQGWYTGIDGFYRTPNHLNPVKKSIAENIMFPEIDFGEDRKYSDRLIRVVKSEVYIDRQIYFYRMEKDKYELA